MQRAKVHRTFLRQMAERLETVITDPLYKGLSQEALHSYLREKTLHPLPGSLATGKGVCWTNDIEHAFSFAKGTPRKVVLVSNLDALSDGRMVVDTRKRGYEKHAASRINTTHDLDPYELWQEILKDDTITYDGGPSGRFTYAAREPILRDRILYELQVEVRP